MNVAGNSGSNEMTNVVPLFSSVQVEMPDPLQELLQEAEIDAWKDQEEEAPVVRAKRNLVTENQFPDQSIYALEQQLAQLNENMARLKFYLTDLDDLLPR